MLKSMITSEWPCCEETIRRIAVLRFALPHVPDLVGRAADSLAIGLDTGILVIKPSAVV